VILGLKYTDHKNRIRKKKGPPSEVLFLCYNKKVRWQLMAKVLDPLKCGFYCVGYVLNGEDKVATFFQMESAQEALVKMMRMGIECKGMWEWKNK